MQEVSASQLVGHDPISTDSPKYKNNKINEPCNQIKNTIINFQGCEFIKK